MAFVLRQDPTDTRAIDLPISTNAVSAGDALVLAIGSTTWSDAASSSEYWLMKAIAIEDVTTSASYVKAIMVQPGQLWEADTTNSSAATDNGDRMVLTDKATVNNTGTDSADADAFFIQKNIVGATTDKKILGWIIYGCGVNPDAT